MTPGEWVSIGGVAVSMIMAGVALRRGGAEARQLDSANSTQIGRAGIEMATADRDRLDKIQTQLDEIRAREVAREHLLIRHASWDHRMIDRVRAALPEFDIEDPPPLWLNSQTAG